MCNNKYNGWTNYATWNVALWLSNDEYTSEYWQDEAKAILEREGYNRQDATQYLSKQLEDEITEAMPEVKGMFADLLGHALGAVDWYEIAEHYINDIELFSAGWNMPGYMPDSDPQVFIDAEDALEYIKEEAKEDVMREGNVYANSFTEEEKEGICSIIDSWEVADNGEFGDNVMRMHYFISRI